MRGEKLQTVCVRVRDAGYEVEWEVNARGVQMGGTEGGEPEKVRGLENMTG